MSSTNVAHINHVPLAYLPVALTQGVLFALAAIAASSHAIEIAFVIALAAAALFLPALPMVRRSINGLEQRQNGMPKQPVPEGAIASNTMLDALLESTSDHVYFKDLNSRFVKVSRAQARSFGIDDSAEIVGKSDFDYFTEEHARPAYEDEQSIIRTGCPVLDLVEKETRTDLSVTWVTTSKWALRDAQGSIVGTFGISKNITQLKQAEEQVLHNALYDPLTGLPNRVLFNDRLRGALERSKRSAGYLFAVLYLDFDRFKVINDSLGHPAGDQFLIEGARRLAACVRSVDTVARVGGDEFVLLLDGISGGTEAGLVAERIQSRVLAPFNLERNRVFITASIGILLGNDKYEQTEDVLRDADIAMYHAKTLGGGHHELFDEAMRVHVTSLLALETDLQQAVERGEFLLHYQPILALESGNTVGFEALVRWQHPVRGLVAPAEFIPVAEETGAIAAIGRWVLREACRQMRAWQTQFPSDPPLTISVNLSAKQLAQSDLGLQVAEVLRETELDPKTLILEITENMVVQDMKVAGGVLSALRALGIELRIDDFGTGYCNLGYLQKLPIDTLKIDRTFINRIGSNENGSEIVQTILALAHSLGMKVVAEGVESGNQLEKLRQMKCEYAQGYLFARPKDSKAATELIGHVLLPASRSIPASAAITVSAPGNV